MDVLIRAFNGLTIFKFQPCPVTIHQIVLNTVTQPNGIFRKEILCDPVVGDPIQVYFAVDW